MFFVFDQNNSGGSFDFDEESGITHYVIIEADTEGSAIEKAEGIGIYFDGCNKGLDCDCCGDRWSDIYIESNDSPKIYDKHVSDESAYSRRWMKDGMEACVHYKDGRKEWF